jgi:ketosteroid isomerase-like protein
MVRGWETVERGDVEVRVRLVYDPSAEINLIGDALLSLGFAERYLGHDGLREFDRTWASAWVSARYTPEELIDLGDRVVVRLRLTLRGARSGAEVTDVGGHVFYFRDGLVVRQDLYYDWSDCVEALGLGTRAQSASASS